MLLLTTSENDDDDGDNNNPERATCDNEKTKELYIKTCKMHPNTKHESRTDITHFENQANLPFHTFHNFGN